MKVRVHEAGISDLEGAKLLLGGIREGFSRMKLVWVDYAYRGLSQWLKDTLGWKLEVVKHWWTGGMWVLKEKELPPVPAGFRVLPRRWVVERTFGWLGRNRRSFHSLGCYLFIARNAFLCPLIPFLY